MNPTAPVCLALLLGPQTAHDLGFWRQVTQPTDAPWPEPLGEVVWRTDLSRALDEARDSGRPLFVTLRCLPCKQCASFDASLMESSPELDRLLSRFITVRLTDAAALDLALLPAEGFQDLDLSWWGWFLSPRGEVYGVFGGRDEVSDETRISIPALRRVMERVLTHHADPRRASFGLDGPAPEPEPRFPSDLPGYASWQTQLPAGERGECLHCHQVAEILRQPALDAGTFDKERDLEPWPLPENAGLSIDRDDGLRVVAVVPESAAQRAGLRPDDELVAAGGRLLFGQTDLRGVLQRAPRTDARIPLVWRRGAELQGGDLVLDEGWKRTVLDWRMSVSQGNVGARPGFWPGDAGESVRARLGIASRAMAVRPWFGRAPSGPAWEAGLRPSDVVLAVGGQSPPLSGRVFLVWFRRRYDPGDAVELEVARGPGPRRRISYRP